jgi:glutamate carboxypeptidase
MIWLMSSTVCKFVLAGGTGVSTWSAKLSPIRAHTESTGTERINDYIGSFMGNGTLAKNTDEQPTPRALLNSAKSRHRELLAFIRRLVETESPSLDKQAVDRCGELLADAFSKAGARVRVHNRSAAGNIIQADFYPSARTTHGSAAEASARRVFKSAIDDRKSTILMLGHFDTVWDVGTLKKMPCREQKGRLYGPGVYDMKAGIAIALYALRVLQEHGSVPRPVTVLLNTDEELHSDHSRELIEATAKKSAAVLVFEPSADKGAVKTARKGVGEFRVNVTGISSHAGLKLNAGANAIVELARQIERITGFIDDTLGMTVSVGTIHGGTRPNVVPAHAEAVVDARIARAKDAVRLQKLFKALKPFNKKCKLDISGGINRMPMERTTSVVALYHTAQAVAADLGFQLGEASVGGGSDGNFTAALGIPTLDGLGAVGEGAHAVNESIVISELPRRVALAAGLLQAI